MGVLPIAAEFRLSAGMQPNLVAKEPSKTFSDIQNYGAASIITQMSFYCSVAAAINEMGRFAPKDSAKPNYAAAATLRMLKCVKDQ
jgi:N-acetylmuramoyl-L-alanine amidase